MLTHEKLPFNNAKIFGGFLLEDYFVKILLLFLYIMFKDFFYRNVAIFCTY